MTRYFFSTIAAMALMLVAAQAAPQPPAPHAKPSVTRNGTSSEKKNATHQEDGQRIFDQQCSRCHAAPEGFSARISGTIVRHMRVRASLSQRDEQELLRFLNP